MFFIQKGKLQADVKFVKIVSKYKHFRNCCIEILQKLNSSLHYAEQNDYVQLVHRILYITS